MKYIAGAVFVLLTACAYLSVSSEAEAIVFRPFGGRVTMTTYMPEVLCTTGMGPTTIETLGSPPGTPSTDYLFPFGKTSPPRAGAVVLGLYMVKSPGGCQTGPPYYPDSYSTYRGVVWGSSK